MEVYLKILFGFYLGTLTYILYWNSRPTTIHIHQANKEILTLTHFQVSLVRDLVSWETALNEKTIDNNNNNNHDVNLDMIKPQTPAELNFERQIMGQNNDESDLNQDVLKHKTTSAKEDTNDVSGRPIPLVGANVTTRFDADVAFNETLLDLYHNQTTKYRRLGICSKLFMNNSRALSKAKELHATGFRDDFLVDVKDFPSITQNCEVYKDKRGFTKPTATPTKDSNSSIAFSILTYNDIEQFERFLRILYEAENVYCIHIDQKSSQQFKNAVLSISNCFPNVFIASKLETIVYASFSRLQADINCMNDLLQRKEKWQYLLNFASSEMPLKSRSEMVQILKVFNGANDIHEVFSKRASHRYVYRYHIRNGKIRGGNEFLSLPPYNLNITKGQAYNIFSRSYLEFALSSKIAKQFLDWCKDTYSPDEHFWATLNNLYHNAFLDTPGGYKGNPDTKSYVTRHINWHQSWDHCYGEYVRNVCVFSYGDLPLLKMKGHFGTNKFNLRKNPIAYSCMEELLSERQMQQKPVDTRHWTSINFVQNSNT